jgi:hypothetical protein
LQRCVVRCAAAARAALLAALLHGRLSTQPTVQAMQQQAAVSQHAHSCLQACSSMQHIKDSVLKPRPARHSHPCRRQLLQHQAFGGCHCRSRHPAACMLPRVMGSPALAAMPALLACRHV